MVRDQTHSLAGQRGEFLLAQHIDAVEYAG
jgi:hypothetical protein